MNRVGIVGLILIGVIAVNPLISPMVDNSSLGTDVVPQTMIEGKSIQTTTYSPSFELHDRISISDDLDWDEQGIPGAGTEEDPYIIENLEIVDDHECIFIVYTSMHFIIRNCLLRSDSMSGEGIWINHADHGRVENCTIMMKSYGVYVMNTYYLVVTDNTMYNLGHDGIRMYDSHYCNITDNTIYDASDHGIYAVSSVSRFEHNIIWHSDELALFMRTCNSATVRFNTFWNSSTGVYLESSDSVTFSSNSICNNRGGGFDIYDCDTLTFSNNTIRDNGGDGVSWNRGDDATISMNQIGGNSLYGFYMYYARNNVLSDNVFENDGLVLTGGDILDFEHTVTGNLVNGKTLGYFFNVMDTQVDGNSYGQIIAINCSALDIQGGLFSQTDIGIVFSQSNNCTLNSTYISNQMRGVFLQSSDFCNVTYTTFEKCGVYITGNDVDNWIHNLTGSTVNGKPIGYFYDESDQILDDDSLGQIIVVNSTRVSIRDYNFTDSTLGIALAFSTDCNVSEIVTIAGYAGLRLQECNNCVFENITMLHPMNMGFLSYYSNDCTLRNITVLESGYGVYLSGCYDFVINGSRFSFNNYGAYLRSSGHLNFSHCVFEHNYDAFYTYYYDNSTIYDCDVLYNRNNGIRIYFSDWIDIQESTVAYNSNHGIFYWSSRYGEIVGNTVTHNQADGIHLFYGDRCDVINNTVEENTGYGINLYVFSDYNTVFRNNISSNLEGNCYAYQSTNTWDDGVSIGNYWDDYYGPGVYYIPGPGNNVDRYPRSPAVILTIHSDVNYHLGTIGASFTWTAFSTEPDYYIIYKEGAVQSSGAWDGLDVTAVVDTSTLGVFNYSLFINGTSGEYKIDTVLVTIYDSTPTIDSPHNIQYHLDTTGHSIIWNPSDLNPYGYFVYYGGDLYESGPWDGSTVQVDIDGLSLGTHIFTLYVNDTSGNGVSDSVEVMVWDSDPWVEPPEDITYVFGTPDVEIFWNASDYNPYNYTIYRNSTVEESNTWNGQPITYNIEGLPVGVYNYTLKLVDSSEQATYDTVLVFVVPETTTTSSSPTTTIVDYSTIISGNGTELDSMVLLTISVGFISMIMIVGFGLMKKYSRK